MLEGTVSVMVSTVVYPFTDKSRQSSAYSAQGAYNTSLPSRDYVAQDDPTSKLVLS